MNRKIEVHHESYDRLGDEADEDLQALCRGCHHGHHVHDVTTIGLVYIKIVSTALKEEHFTHLSDLIEEVKVRCARARIPYQDGQVQAVIARMDVGDRFGIQVPTKIAILLDERQGYEPLSRAEAAGWMAKLGAIPKTILDGPRFTRRQADSLLVIRNVLAPAVLDSIQRCEAYERMAAAAEQSQAVDAVATPSNKGTAAPSRRSAS